MSKARPKNQPSSIVNRRARFDYQLDDKLTVGVVLSGPEVRAARDKKVGLKGSFVTLRNGELFLNNASFTVKPSGSPEQPVVDTQARKLLATKKQIANLERTKQAGMSIVPTKLLTGGRYIKLEIATGRGKKAYDKRQTIKKRQQDRESKQMIGKIR